MAQQPTRKLNDYGLIFNIKRDAVDGLDDIDKEATQYNEVAINTLADTTKRKDNILIKIAEQNIINDTAKADIYKNKYKADKENIKTLSTVFCDNIVFYGITHESRIKNKACIDCGIYNTIIRDYFRQHLNNQDLNIKVKGIGIIKDFKDKITNTQKQTFIKTRLLGVEPTEKGIYAQQRIMASTPDIPINKLLEIIKPENIKYLREQGLYIADMDFTADIGGCMDKDKLIKYLMDKHEFTYNEKTADKDIIDNREFVGNTCLTFLVQNNGITLRPKFYNKFIQSLESGGVRKKVGSHLADWVNNPEKRLRNTIKSSLPYGHLRLEITYYTGDNCNKTPTLEQIEANINYLKDLLKGADDDTYFYCKIEDQYKAIIDIVKENLIIYDKTNKMVLLTRWINNYTKKINGILKTNISREQLLYMFKFLTFNKPIRLILIEYVKQDNKTQDINDIKTDTKEYKNLNELEEDLLTESETEDIKKVSKDKNTAQFISKDDKTILINCRTYNKIKEDDQELTAITDEAIFYVTNSKRDTQPIERGIIKHNNIMFYIPTKRDYIITDTHYKVIDTDLQLQTISGLTIKKLQKKEDKILQDSETDITELKQLKQDQQIAYNKFLQKQDFKKQIEEDINNIIEGFAYYDLDDTNHCVKKLTDFKKNDTLKIIAIKQVETRYGQTYIIYDMEQGIKLWCNSEINRELNKILKIHSGEFSIIQTSTTAKPIFYLLKQNRLQNILNITILGKSRDYNNNLKADLTITRNALIDLEEDEDEVNITNYSVLDTNNIDLKKIKISNCYKIDTLNEDNIYYIWAIDTVKYSKSKHTNIKYVFKLLDSNLKPMENIFCSNYFMEINKVLEDMYYKTNSETLPPICIKIGAERTTPAKNKAKQIYLTT